MKCTQDDYQKAADTIVKKMVVDSIVGFDMLKLENEQYAAFWCGGYETNYTTAIAEGEYNMPPLAHIGDIVSTSHYLKFALDDMRRNDPVNYGGDSLNPNGPIAKTLRKKPLKNLK